MTDNTYNWRLILQAPPVHVHWSGVWGACSALTVSSGGGVSA